jgi:hypothetical protein
MIRTLRGLAVTGLIAVALSAWMFHAYMVKRSVQEAIAAQIFLHTSTLLSFSAGLLTLTLTVPRRQRHWSAALLVSLLLNGYWPFASFSEWWFVLIPPLASVMLALPFALQFLVAVFVPVTPALLALGYTIRAAGRGTPTPAPLASQAPQIFEEGSLDITIEPLER